MIPARAHFVWFGPNLPYAYIVGIRSAAISGGFSDVYLHHADELVRTPELDRMLEMEGVSLRPLNDGVLEDAPIPESVKLVDLFRRLSQPAAKANMMRAAILATEGGIYLDTDTLTLKDLTPLRQAHEAFCGAEHIALPREVKESKNPLVWARAGLLMGYRDVCRRRQKGWQHFRRFEHLFPAVANNAVLASTPKHTFMTDLLEAMLTLPPAEQLVRFALGTKLLQHRVALDPDGCALLAPETFFPIGPEVSQHWFREDTAIDLDEMIFDETSVIHWYASVRTKSIIPKIDPAFIRRHADSIAFCRAALSFI